MASPAFVQSKSPTIGAGSTLATTFDSTPTNGNLIVAAFLYASLSTFTPPSGFTQALHVQQGAPDGGLFNFWIGYKVAGASESSTVTGSQSPAGVLVMVIHEYSPGSGQTWTSPVDVSASTLNGYGGVTSVATGTTGATAQNDAVAFAFSGTDNFGTILSSWDNSFTAREANYLNGEFSADKILTATGTQTSTRSWTTSARSGAAIVVFKPSVAADPRVPRSPAVNFQDPAVFMRGLREKWERRRSGIYVPSPGIALALETPRPRLRVAC